MNHFSHRAKPRLKNIGRSTLAFSALGIALLTAPVAHASPTTQSVQPLISSTSTLQTQKADSQGLLRYQYTENVQVQAPQQYLASAPEQVDHTSAHNLADRGLGILAIVGIALVIVIIGGILIATRRDAQNV